MAAIAPEELLLMYTIASTSKKKWLNSMHTVHSKILITDENTSYSNKQKTVAVKYSTDNQCANKCNTWKYTCNVCGASTVKLSFNHVKVYLKQIWGLPRIQKHINIQKQVHGLDKLPPLSHLLLTPLQHWLLVFLHLLFTVIMARGDVRAATWKSPRGKEVSTCTNGVTT